jgi:hypothetical protein
MRGVEAEPAVPGVYAVLYGAIGVMGAVMGTATATSFDQQLARVTALTQALQRSNEHLEARVVERTRALRPPTRPWPRPSRPPKAPPRPRRPSWPT